MMKQQLMTIFSRTPVAVGAGNSVGAIDLPIMRERHTRIPVIPGSSVKGVLRDLWSNDKNEEANIFGKTDEAGKLIVGEARVLAFPLRSARGMFAWITCPLALERFKRDGKQNFEIPSFGEKGCCAPQELQIPEAQKIILEEYCFDWKEIVPSTIVEALKSLSSDPVWADEVENHLAIISNDMFSYFVENACEVPSRIRINDQTGVVEDGMLFCQEQVPSETLFYGVLASGEADILDQVAQKINENKVLQFGGDETVGLGYCSVEIR
ncbi:MAG: type III-B CRISPR module RAMP protein Cmr4 [Victivallaceae bacterium]|nr:type III-B CRISPR module RAMP protein Cmr4 [Victivallaceae bacterium]